MILPPPPTPYPRLAPIIGPAIKQKNYFVHLRRRKSFLPRNSSPSGNVSAAEAALLPDEDILLLMLLLVRG